MCIKYVIEIHIMANRLTFLMQVLQRKTEEAAIATKRLKELLEARKSSARENSGEFLFFFFFPLFFSFFHFQVCNYSSFCIFLNDCCAFLSVNSTGYTTPTGQVDYLHLTLVCHLST